MKTIEKKETMKYADILAYNEANNDNIITIWDEMWEENDTLYTETDRIVNPENEQTLIYWAYVPLEFKEEYEDEVELAMTNRYYQWTSEFTDFINEYKIEIETKEEFEEKRDEAIEEWNSTELGEKYPISKEDIEWDEWNSYLMIISKNFNTFM